MARKDSKTTPSQDVMLEHLAYLVLHENKPVCWRDFQKFVVDGKEYSLKKGTIRNNLSRLKRLGLIEFSYRSIDAYYSLHVETNRKTSTMTAHPARVYRHDLAALIERMAFDTPAAHDIHLRFHSQMIWRTLSVLAAQPPILQSLSLQSSRSATLSTQPVSKDIVLPEMTLGKGIKGIVTVHKTDTVTVILSCSESPIRFDIGGLVVLSSSLARIEERLLTLIDNAQHKMLPLQPVRYCLSSAANPAVKTVTTTLSSLLAQFVKTCSNNREKALLHIPEYGSWVVTMWHIGRDSIERYTGEKFEVAWQDFSGEWIRVYSKEMMIGKSHPNKGKKSTRNCILRIERQEYPKERLRNAVEQKLSMLCTPTMHSPHDG
jgi:hypothetical protein